MSRYQLHLISPRQRFINYPAHSELAKIFGRRRLMTALSLPTVAALTPDHYDLRIFDEEIEDLPRGARPDLVGITTLSATAKRAYQLGDAFRAQGVKVVFGGPHASFATEEALRHCDSVVVGEAEGAWERCLADFERGALQPTYRAEGLAEFRRQRPPRWDLVNMRRLFQVSVQSSRGCPFDCDFCTVTRLFGRTVRHRDIDDVVAEIRAAPTKYVLFVDDNLTINKAHARELMRALKPLGISWACMSSLEVAQDEELLAMMAEAGCFNILIGFESLNPRSLEETNKRHNQGGVPYQDAVRRIHAAGIQINASFVVGFDHDDLSEFDRIYDFTLEQALPNVNLHLLGAAPGSETHRTLTAQGRVPDYDPDLGDGHFPVLHYLNFSQADLLERYVATLQRLYSFSTVRQKAERLFSSGAFWRPGGDIGPLLKARLSLIVLKEFVLSLDPERRRLFWFIFRLIRAGKLAVDKGLGFLLSMLGVHRHIEQHRRSLPEYRRLVSQTDQGPWKDRPALPAVEPAALDRGP